MCGFFCVQNCIYIERFSSIDVKISAVSSIVVSNTAVFESHSYFIKESCNFEFLRAIHGSIFYTPSFPNCSESRSADVIGNPRFERDSLERKMEKALSSRCSLSSKVSISKMRRSMVLLLGI